MPDSDPSAGDAINALLAEVNALALRLRQLGRRQAHGGLPAAESMVLEILRREGPRTVPQIAKTRLTSRQNIQILVNALAARGLVEFIGNPAHKRSALIRLTKPGAELVSKFVAKNDDNLRWLADRIPLTKLDAAREVLTEVERLLQRDVATTNGNVAEHAGASGRQPSRRPASRRIKSKSLSLTDEMDSGELPVSLL